MTKIIQLAAPEKNEELQLEKEEQYYPMAHVEGVAGLEKFVQKYTSTVDTAKKADQLTIPRKINGVPFDGSRDITLPSDEALEKRIKELEMAVVEVKKQLLHGVFVKEVDE